VTKSISGVNSPAHGVGRKPRGLWIQVWKQFTRALGGFRKTSPQTRKNTGKTPSLSLGISAQSLVRKGPSGDSACRSVCDNREINRVSGICRPCLSATRPVFTRAYTKSILVEISGNGKCVLTSDRHRTRGSIVVAEAQRYSKRMVCVLYRPL
jgi:hypothetical protein